MSSAWVLAIDTSRPNGGLALARGGDLVESVDIVAPDGFGHTLFGELDALLKRHVLQAAGIDCFAAAAGPGSFTGLRVALAAVKGLAESTGKPALGISNLQALAWHGSGAIRAPYFDARRQQIYGGLYDAQLNELAHEIVCSFDVWQASLPDGAELITSEQSLATAVAAIAYQRLMAGDVQDPVQLEANYVRRSDAELNWKDN